MVLRKWIVRGVVFAILGGLGTGAFLYLRWTDPAVVRQMVVEQLSAHLPGTNVTLDAARLRLLGGIAFQELRLIRRDDPDRTDLFYVPSGVIYHDKEQLAHGKMAIRKIELHRPRIRIVREPDGRWNMKGILGPVDLSKTIPTILIQQGTLFFEDRTHPVMPVLEMKQVTITILNDPLPTLNFQATGQTDLAGPVQVRGTWQRATQEMLVTLDVPTIPVGPGLVQRLTAYAPQFAEDARYLEGAGTFQARFHYRPESQQWDHDLRAHLSKARFRHALLPLPLEALEASAQIINGRVTLENLTARAGTARVQLSGERESFREDAELRGELKVEDLNLTPELFEQLPSSLQVLRKIHTDYSPEGPIDLTYSIQKKGAELVQHGVITPKGLRLCFTGFRYPVEEVIGTITVHVAPQAYLEPLELKLTGKASGQPVQLSGLVAGPKPARVDLHITGKHLPLDEQLIDALPARFQDLARSFHARGQTDFEVFIRREQGNEHFSNRYVARIHDAAVRYDVFPYPLENVSGILEILPDHWEVRELFGSHKGAEVRGQGRSHLVRPGSQSAHLELRGKNLLLDAELKTALERSAAAGVKPAWEALQPHGRIDFRALIDLPPEKAPPEFDVSLVPRGCSVQPGFFPYALDELDGLVHYTRGKVELRNLSARHGGSAVRLPAGEILLKPGGGFFAMIPRLEANPLLPDEDLLRALPGPLRAGLTALQLREPLSFATELRVDMPAEAGTPPLLYWDGGVVLQNAAVRLGVTLEQVNGRVFSRGRYNGRQLEGVQGHVQLDQAVMFDQPLRNIHGRLEVWKDAPEVLRIPELTASFFGGHVGGQARVEFGPTFRYELDLTALQVKLEQMGRHNLRDKADLSGEAVARLYVRGEGAELTGLEGGGSIDIPNGKLYNLPLLLDLLKFLAVRLPDRTAFEEAHARFTIHGPRVQINRLELLGNVISLGGEGQMNLDGTSMDIDLYAVWGRIMQMLPPPVKEVPPWISKQFLKIKARGQVSDPKFEKEAVPALVEPVKGLLQRMTK